MFDGAPGGGWDVWNLRVLTTGAGGLAEGLTWDNNTLTTDNGNLKVAYDNGSPTGNDPDYCHKDTCEFDGHILLMEDKIHYNDPITVGNDTTYWKATDGWIVGHKIPAGTGLREYNDIIVGSKEEYESVMESASDIEETEDVKTED